jgi:aspartate kinase
VPLIVQKFGGTSVGTPERLRAVAQRVVRTRRAGNDVVVVVSAMGHATDELVELARTVTGRANPGRRHPREMDMLLSTGERTSMALLSMAIAEEGAEAISFTGSQAAIVTDGRHGAARILEVRGDRVREELARGCIVIVAGFQGVSRKREITTLGRGGSDTTAVALAAALGAARCEIFTDVAGVFTADPRRVPDARVIPEIDHAEMLELAAAGAQVMHARAVEIGARFGVDIHVLPAHGPEGPGTIITRTTKTMEDLVLTGITSTGGQARLALRGMPAGITCTAEVTGELARRAISVDMVSETVDSDGRAHLLVTVEEEDVEEARLACEEVVGRLGGEGVETTTALSSITLVGSGMHGRPGVFAEAFGALAAADIETLGVSTSAVSITVLVSSEDEAAALRMLHAAFQLHAVSAREAVSETPAARG